MRTDLTTDQSTDLYNQTKDNIQDMAILNENLLFLGKNSGINSLPKNANSTVAAEQVITTGLENCSLYTSIHVADGKLL